MEITIDDAIQHIKNSCYIVGYPTHDKQQETRKRVNASLNMAIDIMRKYQKIQEIVEHWACCGNPSDSMIATSEVIEDRNDENVLVGCIGCKYSGVSKYAVCNSCINMNRYEQEVLEDGNGR